MEGPEGDGALGAEIGHLAPGVNPGVSAPRADEGHLFASETLQYLFQSLLNGGGISLPLPTVIAGAVVFQEEADVAVDAFHGGLYATFSAISPRPRSPPQYRRLPGQPAIDSLPSAASLPGTCAARTP